MLLFMDGFDSYENGSELATTGRWQSGPSALGTQYARSQGKGVHPGNATTPFGDEDHLIFGFAFNCQTSQSANIVTLVDVNGNTMCVLGRDNSNHLYLSGDDLVCESTNTFTNGVWYYLEFEIVISDSGSGEIWMDGESWASGSGDSRLRNDTTTINRASFGGNFYMDDLYIINTEGDNNNSRLGDVRCVTIVPTADGSSVDWVSNSFANHRAIGHNIDDDSSFVESGSVGATDLFQYEDSPFDSGTILAIQTLTTAKRGVDATHNFCPVTKSGGTVYEGDSVSLTTSYDTILQIQETDPDTGDPWGVSGLNAAEFGYRLLS